MADWRMEEQRNEEAPIWELSSTHWVSEFVNQISPIQEWIQTSFVNLILRFIKDLMQSIHLVYILDAATVLMNAWSRARTELSRLLLNSCSNCGVFLHKSIIWLQRTLIYCTDYSIFTFIILTRITRLFFRNFTLCVQLKQVWNITSASNIDHTCYVRLEYLVRRDGLFMNLLIFDFLVPGTTD